MDNPEIINTLPISYETDNVRVNFNIEFGKGIDSFDEPDEYLRKIYNTPYNFEKFTNDQDVNMYRLLAEEGPFVLNITNVKITSKNNYYEKENYEYEYGMTCVIDLTNEPLYNNSTTFVPYNIERDGKPWCIKNNKTLKVDQNGSAKFQWTTARALDKGIKPTSEQELMGVEERHENSGMIYITFQPIYTEKEVVIYRCGGGVTRGFGEGVTRGLTRGINSSPARVGYGSSASTSSTSVEAKAIADSRYILPIRFRIIGETSDKTKCAKDLKSAMYVDELQKKTAVMPDLD
tara:strand:- start:4978 stop:5850 length:873 start_codon:yes stop_codon:yes gene_type:complete